MQRIAIIHDYLTQFGGAERVALALAQAFQAPLFTSVYQPERTLAEFRSLSVTTTSLQHAINFVPGRNFRYLAPLYVRAFRSLDLSEFDTVIRVIVRLRAPHQPSEGIHLLPHTTPFHLRS